MNHHTHRTIYNQALCCLMAVAETAKSSCKASGESRPRTKSKFKSSTCRKAHSALSSGDVCLQGNQGEGYSLPCPQSQFNSALSRSSTERYAPSQTGSGDDSLRFASLHYAPCTRPSLFGASQNSGGSLLSGNSVNLKTSGDINNSGTILGRKYVSITADNINNSNAILGGTVALTSKTDINNTGGNITAKDALLIDAGRDLNVVTNTNTTVSGGRTATTLDRVAGLYVTSPTGILVANAGNNINLTAAQIKSAGSAQFQTTNGSINLSAATAGESLRFGSTGEATFHQNLAQSQQTGTSIQTGGNLSMVSGKDITGVAADIQAGGTADMVARGNINFTEGRSTKTEDLAWVATSTDFLSKTTTATSIQSRSSTATGNTISGASGVTMQATGGTLLLSGAQVTSKSGNISLSGAEVVITSALNSQSNSFEQESKKSGIGLSDLAGPLQLGKGLNHKKKENEDTGDTSLAQTSITGQNVQVTSTAGNITLKAAAISATGTTNTTGAVTLDAGNGTVNLQTLQTTAYQSKSVQESDIAWQSTKGSGSQNQNTNYNQINGNLSVTASKVNIEGTGANLKETAQKLATQPGMDYLNQLANDPALKDKIDWKKVDEAHKNWNYSQSGLSPAGAAILSLAVAYATAGAGSGAASALGMGTTTTVAGVSTFTASAAGLALNAATSAAITSLTTQAAVGMANNGGDISKTLDQMGQSSAVKGLLTSMATAGALKGLSTSGLLPDSIVGANAKSPFTDQLAKNLIDGAASAVVNSAINGTSLEDNLKTSIVSAIINTAAAQGANAIGDAATGTLTEPAKINELGRTLAHAIAGCAAGAAQANSRDGCTPGALGAVVGELSASFYNDGSGQPKADTVQFAALMSGIAGAVVGGDDKSVNLAAGAGANAAANNYLLHPDRTALNAAKAKLSASIADCNLACKDEAQKEVTRLEALDKANDDKWKSACDTNPSSPECTSQTKYTSLDLETQAKSARQPTVLNSLSTPTVTPTAACANNDPDCKAGISAGRNGDQYGRPDYLAVQVGVFGTGGSLSLNLHTGDLFWGLSQSVPVTPSLNLVTGNINGNSGPTSSEKGAVTNDFLGGASVQAGGCTSVICISGNKSIGGKEALEVGVGLPSPPTPVGGAGVSFPLPFRLPIGTPLQPIPPSVKEKP